MSEGLFAVLGSTVVAFFAWLQRREDRRAEDRRRKADRDAQREDRLATELSRTRNEGAATVARVRTFLSNVNPMRSAANFQNPALEETLARLDGAWDALQEPLGILAVRLPTQAGRELADDLIAAVSIARNRVQWLLIMMSRGEDFDKWLEESELEWTRANDLAKQFREALHQAEPSPPAIT